MAIFWEYNFHRDCCKAMVFGNTICDSKDGGILGVFKQMSGYRGCQTYTQ